MKITILLISLALTQIQCTEKSHHNHYMTRLMQRIVNPSSGSSSRISGSSSHSTGSSTYYPSSTIHIPLTGHYYPSTARYYPSNGYPRPTVSCPKGWHYVDGTYDQDRHYYEPGYCDTNESGCANFDRNAGNCLKCMDAYNLNLDPLQGDHCVIKWWIILLAVLGVVGIALIVFFVLKCLRKR